jgi:Peptidase family M28
VFWLLLGALMGAQVPVQPDSTAVQDALQAIRGRAIRAHMRFLSDTMLEGRAPGSRGYDIAARYVQTQLEAMGLKPAGTKGSWYQTVPLRKSVVDAGKSSLTLTMAGKEDKLTDGKDYLFAPDMLRTESTIEAPVVFVGFGVTAPNQKYDDYAGADVKGKIVATFYGAPAKFPSTERAYYSDGLVKQRNAVAHGAIGMIDLMLPEDWKRYAWDWLRPQIEAGDMRWLDGKGAPHDAYAELKGRALLSDGGGKKLFAGASKNLEQVADKARNSEPQAFPLAVTARLHVVSTHTTLESPNVVGKIEGSDPVLRNEYVVYTAHVDHLGICPPAGGDNVCHGAVDNASGTATLLEVAHAYASLPRAPRRSVVFVFVTGEEMGLLGSDFYAISPTVPQGAIVANVNIDGAPGLYFAMRDVVPMGPEHSTLAKNVESAVKELGYELSPDPMPEEVSFIRSDQYSFVLQGIPAVYITDGVKAVDPKIDGLTVIKNWLTTRYHTPADNMEQPLDFESAAKGARLNFLIGYEVAQQDKRPEWNQGDFFGTTFGKK